MSDQKECMYTAQGMMVCKPPPKTETREDTRTIEHFRRQLYTPCCSKCMPGWRGFLCRANGCMRHC